MKQNLNFLFYLGGFIPKSIMKDQEKDVGMAMVLILLFVGLFFKSTLCFQLALVILVVNMIWPKFFRPLAFLWFGLAHLLGSLVSKILLSLIFFLLVTPVGLMRRVMGKDSLRLKQFKSSSGSIMVSRNITYSKKDVERPF
jgi:hypothetical protein